MALPHLSHVPRVSVEPAPGADGRLVKHKPIGLAVAVVDGQVLHVEWNVRDDWLRDGRGARGKNGGLLPKTLGMFCWPS